MQFAKQLFLLARFSGVSIVALLYEDLVPLIMLLARQIRPSIE
jgi:hypothetical protein